MCSTWDWAWKALEKAVCPLLLFHYLARFVVTVRLNWSCRRGHRFQHPIIDLNCLFPPWVMPYKSNHTVDLANTLHCNGNGLFPPRAESIIHKITTWHRLHLPTLHTFHTTPNICSYLVNQFLKSTPLQWITQTCCLTQNGWCDLTCEVFLTSAV